MESYGPINNDIAACYINKQLLNTFWMYLSIFIEYNLKELNFAISRIFSKFTKCLKNPYNLSRNFVLENSFCNYNSQIFVPAKPVSKSCFFWVSNKEMKLTKAKILTRTMTKSRAIHLICLINVNIVDDVLHVVCST